MPIEVTIMMKLEKSEGAIFHIGLLPSWNKAQQPPPPQE
jgi:hypothetical protein